VIIHDGPGPIPAASDTSDDTDLLAVSGLSAAHGSAAILQDIDFRVPEGALACLLGPSGCGKTTLLRVIAGLHRPVGGRLVLSGQVMNSGSGQHVPPERRRIGYIPQEAALFPHLDVAANIGFGLSRRQRPARVTELLELTGLGGLGGRYPHELSGGQQQRVALARALASRPQLLLLDEPFAALDTATRRQIRAEVVAAVRGHGATAVLVTHDPDEALAFADEIAVMQSGRIVQAGSPDALYRRPRTGSVARSLGEVNLLPARQEGDRAVTSLGRLRVAASPDEISRVVPPGQLAVIRPEDLHLRARSEGASTGTVARVLEHEYRGRDYRIELMLADGSGRLIAYCENLPATDQVEVTVPGAVALVATETSRED
jgi:iron(III) transport system ATP-binding protein